MMIQWITYFRHFERSEVENHEVLCEAKSFKAILVKISPLKEFLWNTNGRNDELPYTN